MREETGDRGREENQEDKKNEKRRGGN